MTFWFDRFDVVRKMIDIEEKNAGIAIATASIFDEESGHFSLQKSVEIKRRGYKYSHYFSIKINFSGIYKLSIFVPKYRSLEITSPGTYQLNKNE